MLKEINQITIVGVGLIGASLASAIRKKSPSTLIIGVDASEENLNTALNRNIIDRKSTLKSAVSNAEIVIIATPPDTVLRLLIETLDHCADSTVVVDVASVKDEICSGVKFHPRRTQFVAAHPVAGTEKSGPQNAVVDLFANKINFLVDEERSSHASLQRIKSFFEEIGMRNLCIDSKSHDMHFANLSHLSHLLAYTLANTALELESEMKIATISGSGFASTVRLAESKAAMWTPILSSNRRNLLIAIEVYLKKLMQIKNLLEKNDTDKITTYIYEANKIGVILAKKEKYTFDLLNHEN